MFTVNSHMRAALPAAHKYPLKGVTVTGIELKKTLVFLDYLL